MRATYSTQAAVVFAVAIAVGSAVLAVLLSDTVREGAFMAVWFALVGSVMAFARADIGEGPASAGPDPLDSADWP
jgi:hypothetical protein